MMDVMYEITSWYCMVPSEPNRCHIAQGKSYHNLVALPPRARVLSVVLHVRIQVTDSKIRIQCINVYHVAIA